MRWMKNAAAVMCVMALGAAGMPQDPGDAGQAADTKKPPKVTLIEAGQSPQRKLRLKPAEGLKQVTNMDMDQEMSMSMNGQTMPAMSISMNMVNEVVVTNVADNGDITVEFTTTDASMDAPAMPGMDQGFAMVKGMKITTVMDNRGQTKSTKIDPPAGAGPDVQQQMESASQNMSQMSAPLPAQPVGVGAKWKVEQDISANGISMSQTAVYTIVGINGDVVDLEVELTQSAPEQNMNMPGMPPDVTARMKSLDSGGKGTMKLNLKHIAVETAEMDLDLAMDMEVSAQGMNMQMEQDMGMKTTMKSEVAGN